MLVAIATHPKGSENVAMIATDGIFFFDKHPGLKLSATELGCWSYEEREDMFLIKPGMYFDGNGKIRSRGLSRRDLERSIPAIHEAWNERGGSWPSFTVKPDFLIISPRAANHRKQWETAGKISTAEFTHSFDPTPKRMTNQIMMNGIVRSHNHMISQEAYKQGKDFAESTPYDKRFGVSFMQPGSAGYSGLIDEEMGEGHAFVGDQE